MKTLRTLAITLSSSAFATALSALPAHAQISNVDNSGLESIGGTAGFDTSADGDQLYTTVGSLIQFVLEYLVTQIRLKESYQIRYMNM
jgi:hypothetical protein